MKRGAKIIGFVLGVCILMYGAAHFWGFDGRETFEKASRASMVARWWRCRDVARPLLAESNETWIVVYSWSDGLRPMSLTVRNDGLAALAQGHPESEEVVARVRLANAEFSRIALAIDKTGLLCLPPKARDGNQGHDPGRYVIEVATSDYGQTVICDDYTTVDDPWAAYEVINCILSLERHFGDRSTWDPEETATAQGFCSDVRAK